MTSKSKLKLVKLEKKARSGDPESQYLLARNYSRGVGIRCNVNASFYWFKQAALQDYKKAFSWFKRAANRGDTEAHMYLGVCYHNGQGTRKDYKKSIHWLQLAAKESNCEAQYFLGLSYHDGHGVPKNKRMAKFWLHKAAEMDHKQAIALLAE